MTQKSNEAVRAGCLEEAAIQTDPHRDGICGPGEGEQLQRWRLELKLGSATCLPWDLFFPSLRQFICEEEAAVFKQSVDVAQCRTTPAAEGPEMEVSPRRDRAQAEGDSDRGRCLESASRDCHPSLWPLPWV